MTTAVTSINGAAPQRSGAMSDLPRYAAILGFLAVSPNVALAYIDPGNGAYMVQVLFTLIGAAIFYLRHPIRSLQAVGRWILSYFRRQADLAQIDSAPREQMSAKEDSTVEGAQSQERA